MKPTARVRVNHIRYWRDIDNHLELISCQNSRISYPLHNHISVFTIGIVLAGSIIVHINHTAHLYDKNQTFIIPPYVPHSIKANDPYSLLSVCIHKHLFNDSSCDTSKMLIDLDNLLTETLGSDKISQGIFRKLFRCIHALHDIFLIPNTSERDLCIDQVKRKLELFPENRLSVEDMAQTALISKYYFIRRFKQIVDLTPHQFQIQNRIRKAQRLIAQEKRIAEVAMSTGFCDQSHFIKQFEKLLGLTPSIYKLSVGIFKPVNKVPE